MKKVSREEWRKTPKDYKLIRDGQRFVLDYDPNVGTTLVPVEVVKEQGGDTSEKRHC